MNISIPSWTRLRELILFAAVGIANTAVDFAVLNLLILLTHHDHGLWLLPFDAFSFFIAVINSYLLNGRFTFRDSGLRDFWRFLWFAALNTVGLLINTLVVWALSPLLGRLLLSPMVAINVSKILATVFSLCWNYFAMKRWIFRTEKTAKANADSRNDLVSVADLPYIDTAALESETKSAV